MKDAGTTFRTLGHSAFRTTVGLSAVLVLLWIALSGLVAVARNPYLLAVYWFLGLGGLVACAGACTNVFPGNDEEEEVPHPFRALAFLAGAVMIGAIFWSQGRPVVEGNGAGVAAVGVIFAMAAVFGIGGFLVMSVLLLVHGASEKKDDNKRAGPGLDLAPQAALELAEEGKAA